MKGKTWSYFYNPVEANLILCVTAKGENRIKAMIKLYERLNPVENLNCKEINP